VFLFGGTLRVKLGAQDHQIIGHGSPNVLPILRQNFLTCLGSRPALKSVIEQKFSDSFDRPYLMVDALKTALSQFSLLT
jgi:hypothetical protein